MSSSDTEKCLKAASALWFRAALDKAYMLAMKGVASSDPADTDAATLYAESIMDVAGSDHLYDARGRPAPLTPVLVATLASVLKRDPAHIGACHYYIHASMRRVIRIEPRRVPAS